MLHADPDYELYLEDTLEEGGSDAEEDAADDSDDDYYEDDSHEDDSYDDCAEIDDGEHIARHVCSCASPGDQSSQGDPGPSRLSTASSALTGSVSSNLLPRPSLLQQILSTSTSVFSDMGR